MAESPHTESHPRRPPVDIDPSSKTPDQSSGASCLDTLELERLDQSFGQWADQPKRRDIKESRQRIWLIFRLIRTTGAKLGEITALETDDLDLARGRMRLTGLGQSRWIPLPANLWQQLDEVLNLKTGERPFDVDPAHVRRKFYEQAQACGLPKEAGNPSAIRRSRAVELMREGVPMPVVQQAMGQTATSTAVSLMDIPQQDREHILRQFLDRENGRKTSARNEFYAKVHSIGRGDIQAAISLQTLGGFNIHSVITMDSLDRLDIREGAYLTAQIKAPNVHLALGEEEPQLGISNLLLGTVEKITLGKVAAEAILRLTDGSLICSTLTRSSAQRLNLTPGDKAWALFPAHAVILNVEK
ncbi:TOBE domain-containing protein [Desulfovibrio ferrophilus]|uniref:Molybdenum-pterin binding domain protein n=1 Tax=Desulfovibrio ferrophilus TaxID=241368 RepID=A0A2Z6B3G3_9BACT|nr:TOBE domain-containing protein [Desulfovibrio ferrophilus]BBD10047.1 molybdenum-pterin binding domain protein [Desulfovibrio ferrophilus]